MIGLSNGIKQMNKELKTEGNSIAKKKNKNKSEFNVSECLLEMISSKKLSVNKMLKKVLLDRKNKIEKKGFNENYMDCSNVVKIINNGIYYV